jgi:hypothetical protein
MEVDKDIISCVHELGWYRVPIIVTEKSNSHDIKTHGFCHALHVTIWLPG